MRKFPEGTAIVYCEKAFRTLNGKTAHGLVRFTKRYDVSAVIDSSCAGSDSGFLLDGRNNGIPVLKDIKEAYNYIVSAGKEPTYFVIGIAPDGGRFAEQDFKALEEAVYLGLNIDSGLHDFLSENKLISDLARKKGVEIRDVRKPPERSNLHFFSDKIRDVTSFKIALLGTDSAVGKRTTAWLLVDALNKMGESARFVGTGQTAWMQGAEYGVILDSLVNDFVTGEIEHAVWSCWNEKKPSIIIVEGQGSLLNPAYPGGFEIIAAARPDAIVVQHAPKRKFYDGFPGYPMDGIEYQIKALEMISKTKVIALTINHEGMKEEEIAQACSEIKKQTGVNAYDVLVEGSENLAKLVITRMKGKL